MNSSILPFRDVALPFGYERTAAFSPCGKYRYLLTRSWKPGPVMLWVMLNPSTADAVMDDPTIRSCMRLAGKPHSIYGAIHVVNLYALRSSDPRALLKAEDPIGPENDNTIRAEADKANVIVAAWGAFKGIEEDRIRTVYEILVGIRGRAIVCLGLTKAGAPLHPLFVRTGATFENFYLS